ncbi:unnamed protein product [Didymodactylos carnosus]|uniref:Uncharacterized protein n=1 Tax=Didymodactylos carnosus TaxID=1234261 RepID=A0A8S2EMV5_9BILA|nr:unnamed protein product [Didymodactylos carnosus]CAF4000817.1 unnamed protein product [Didymodactylos carnosus]
MESDEEVEYDENKEKGNQDYYADRRDSLTGRADPFVSEENHSKLSKIPGTGHLTSFVRHYRDKYTVKEQRPLQKKKRTFCTLTPNQWLTLLSTFLLPLALAAYGVITTQQDAKEAQSNRDSDIEAADQRRCDVLANAAELRYSL